MTLKEIYEQYGPCVVVHNHNRYKARLLRLHGGKAVLVSVAEQDPNDSPHEEYETNACYNTYRVESPRETAMYVLLRHKDGQTTFMDVFTEKQWAIDSVKMLYEGEPVLVTEEGTLTKIDTPDWCTFSVKYIDPKTGPIYHSA